MADNLKKQKLNMWSEKLQELEERLVLTMQKKGEAAQMGDLRENAAYQDAEEESSVLRKRIDDVKGIIVDLEEEKEIN